MKWKLGRRSENVEDRRGSGLTGGGLKIGCVGLIIVGAISLLMKQNPLKILQLLMEQQQTSQVNLPTQDRGVPAANDEQKEFMSTVLADTEDTWSELFQQMGRTYEKPKLVLFSDAVQSACGTSSSAVGPFYCPLDSQVYLDLTFFHELDRRFGASGDFAQAYVVAHEVGHHVQNLLGISDKVHSLQERSGSQEGANSLSVRLELQADCLAG
ncbi:MAG TPA: neutral zinc metallopeptidase, partial [Acidobacteriota bacterium]|nr:neutral zinc metallopeptidase [Acidobacteriota bacterium]